MTERAPSADDPPASDEPSIEDVEPPSREARAALVRATIVEEFDDEPALCTIYSARGPETAHTTWISAREGSFVALEDAR